jgi:hypothetical protein
MYVYMFVYIYIYIECPAGMHCYDVMYVYLQVYAFDYAIKKNCACMYTYVCIHNILTSVPHARDEYMTEREVREREREREREVRQREKHAQNMRLYTRAYMLHTETHIKLHAA